ncbi:unnamed protein product [Brachionus calyciflorus]|nr:unnamed protein product [Brachionus calyciflorus]
MCANDIFDERYLIALNGQNYLTCDQSDLFQIDVCQVFCRGKAKFYGECKNIQNFTACLCYNQFNGNLSTTIVGTTQIQSVASSSVFQEFAVGFINGSVTYFYNGDIAVTGNYGSKLFSNFGGEKIYYTNIYGRAVTVLGNGEIAYTSSNNISVRDPTWYNTTRFGSNDNTIKIRSMVDGLQKRTLLGHSSMVTSLILLENGDLASGSYDKTIRIWNVNNSYALKTINTDSPYAILSLTLLPNGQIACASEDKIIKIYDKHNGGLIKTLEGHTSGVNGLVLNSNDQLVSVSKDGSIRIWN